jgi:hypothetical protein
MGILDASTVAVELRHDHGFSLWILMLTVFVHYWYALSPTLESVIIGPDVLHQCIWVHCLL